MEQRICKTCGMPMDSEEVLGTEADGTKNRDHCIHCYRDGAPAGAPGPLCQSCGMLMDSDEVTGTEQGGAKSGEYCIYCRKDGAFTHPDITMDEMIELCVPHMTHLDPDEARAQMRRFFPQLKRWVG